MKLYADFHTGCQQVKTYNRKVCNVGGSDLNGALDHNSGQELALNFVVEKIQQQKSTLCLSSREHYYYWPQFYMEN